MTERTVFRTGSLVSSDVCNKLEGISLKIESYTPPGSFSTVTDNYSVQVPKTPRFESDLWWPAKPWNGELLN